jgi:hypothetical protein
LAIVAVQDADSPFETVLVLIKSLTLTCVKSCATDSPTLNVVGPCEAVKCERLTAVFHAPPPLVLYSSVKALFAPIPVNAPLLVWSTFRVTEDICPPGAVGKPCQRQLSASESARSREVDVELACPVFVGDVTAPVPPWSGVVFDVGL